MKTQGQRIVQSSLLGEPVPLCLGDVRFPTKLLHLRQTPKELYAAGNLDLFSQSGVAIVGSRNASEHGLETASRIARAVAEAGLVVISGYAKGIDTAAHRAALEADGTTIFVLPFGFKHFHLKRELKPIARPERLLAVSQFPFGQPWFASAAMKRNETVCGLADSVIVIEAGESGGTVEAAKTARSLGRRLYVVDFRVPAPSAVGNALLISTLHANPLRSLRDVMLVIQGNPHGSHGLNTGAQTALF